MPSFDTVCEANLVEVKNAVENTVKEISTRFDFKGTSASIEIKDKENNVVVELQNVWVDPDKDIWEWCAYTRDIDGILYALNYTVNGNKPTTLAECLAVASTFLEKIEEGLKWTDLIESNFAIKVTS